MFEYELHQARHAELVREAADRRLARQAARAARRGSARQEPEGRVSDGRGRFARAA
ncbi:hypothetical protein [Streptomyces sp. NPDC090025]|uniref:hypothetical protein n=1 Tax=Streptomyces sp. NPDC090025 TaxID=3365922 RepID=UPI003834C8B3